MIKSKLLLAGLLALILAPVAALAQALPDLGGKKVVVVTENAYPPLQFIDPKTGKQIGWEYDAMNEIAKRLNFKVEYQNTSWDAMIQAVSDGQYNIGMTGITIKDDRKEKVDFSDPYMRSETVHAGARRREALHRRQELRRFQGRAGRRAGRHHALLHRRLQRARRQRAEPAHKTVRDVRRHGAGVEDRRRRHRADRRHCRQGLCRRVRTAG